MENQDKRPEVWVARRLMRKGCRCESYTIAYFASKARVQCVTRRFLKNGKEVKEYEVEYETPEQLEDLCFDGYVETGDWVKVDRVFRDYITATHHIDLLNQKLIASSAGCVPKKMVDETIESAKKEISFARKLEKYFDGLFLNDSRQL